MFRSGQVQNTILDMQICAQFIKITTTIKMSMTLQLIIVIVGVFDLNFSHGIVCLGCTVFRGSFFNSDISECECSKYCFPEIGG